MNKVKNKKQLLEETQYTVEKIVGKRLENGIPKYQIKWLGYPHSQNTWEPLNHLQECLHLVEEFESSRKDKGLKLLKNKRKRSITNDTNIKSTTKNNSIKETSKSLGKENELISTNKKHENKSSKAKSKDVKMIKSKISSETEGEDNKPDKVIHSAKLIKEQNNFNSKLTKKTKFSEKTNYLNTEFNGDPENSLEINENKKRLSSKIASRSVSAKSDRIFENIDPALDKENEHFKHNRSFISDNKSGKALLSNSNEDISFSEDENCLEQELERIRNVTCRKGEIGRDRAKRILNSKIVDGEIICNVEWIQPNAREKLLPSEYSNTQIKIYNPFLLLDYYEQGLKFKSEK